MWPKFTWLLMVGQAVAQSSDDVSSSSRVDKLERLRLTRHTPRPVAPCGNFTFTCSLNASTILSETEGKEIEPSLVLYLRKTGDCSGDETLSNEKWGGGVYSVVLTSNLTYKRTGSWAANPGMNPGVISMEPDGRDFTYTIYKVRRPAEGEKDWCFTCRFERKIVATLTVQMKVSSEGNETECQKEEGKCHLPNSIEDKGFTYERKLSLNDCANCTCKKTQQFHCDLQECTVSSTGTPATNTTPVSYTTENTTTTDDDDWPYLGFPAYWLVAAGFVLIVIVLIVTYICCNSPRGKSSGGSSSGIRRESSGNSNSEAASDERPAKHTQSRSSRKSTSKRSEKSERTKTISDEEEERANRKARKRQSKKRMTAEEESDWESGAESHAMSEGSARSRKSASHEGTSASRKSRMSKYTAGEDVGKWDLEDTSHRSSRVPQKSQSSRHKADREVEEEEARRSASQGRSMDGSKRSKQTKRSVISRISGFLGRGRKRKRNIEDEERREPSVSGSGSSTEGESGKTDMMSSIAATLAKAAKNKQKLTAKAEKREKKLAKKRRASLASQASQASQARRKSQSPGRGRSFKNRRFL